MPAELILNSVVLSPALLGLSFIATAPSGYEGSADGVGVGVGVGSDGFGVGVGSDGFGVGVASPFSEVSTIT